MRKSSPQIKCENKMIVDVVDVRFGRWLAGWRVEAWRKEGKVSSARKIRFSGQGSMCRKVGWKHGIRLSFWRHSNAWINLPILHISCSIRSELNNCEHVCGLRKSFSALDFVDYATFRIKANTDSHCSPTSIPIISTLTCGPKKPTHMWKWFRNWMRSMLLLLHWRPWLRYHAHTHPTSSIQWNGKIRHVIKWRELKPNKTAYGSSEFPQNGIYSVN